MASEDPQLSINEVRPTFSAWIGVVLLFVLFGAFVLVVFAAMPRGDRFEEQRGEQRMERLRTFNEEHAKALHEYSWVDKEKGTVRLPINRAMEITVAELAQRKPAPAGDATPDKPPGLQTTAPDKPAPAPTAPAASPTPTAAAVSGPDSMIRNQPAAAANPPDAPPGTQPGPGVSPGASPSAPSDRPPAPPADRGPTPPVPSDAPGQPHPVRGAEAPEGKHVEGDPQRQTPTDQRGHENIPQGERRDQPQGAQPQQQPAGQQPQTSPTPQGGNPQP
jgi:hypothetical protein